MVFSDFESRSLEYIQLRAIKLPSHCCSTAICGKETSGLKSVENGRGSALEECIGDAGRVGMVTRRNLSVKVEGPESEVKALDEIVRA